MRKSRAAQIENAMQPYGLGVSLKMPIHIPIENKIPQSQTLTK